MPVNTVVTDDVETAARFIREGGTVAFPTETVYGLGANVFDDAAVARIFEAKRRPADNPLIAHVASVDQIGELATEITENTERLIHGFFPGPLTVVLRKTERVPAIATAGLETIGVRMPRGEIAHQFLLACGVPVVAPSANLSGRPSPTTWQAVVEDLDGRIDCILKDEPTEIGLESTVVDCTGDMPVLLRQGAVSLEELRSVVPETKRQEPGDLAENRSPGLRHRHYTPRARVMIIDPRANVANFMWSGGKFAYIGTRSFDVGFTAVKICTSVDEYARSLFEFFRECDRLGVDEIYCETVEETGIGAALMDRLRRAAKDD
jgi:L-threonylcarbamoyladenylate synthase